MAELESLTGKPLLVLVGVALAVGAVLVLPMWTERVDDCPPTQSGPLCSWIGVPEGHDAGFHAVVIRDFSESFRQRFDPTAPEGSGRLYPRWVGSMHGGLGAPVFKVYPPWAAATSAIVELLAGVDTTVAIRISASTAVLFALLAFALAGRRLGLPNLAVAAGVVALGLSPFPMIDLYRRFALPTVWAYGWLVLVAAFLWLVYVRGGRGTWVGLVLAAAGLLLTHIISAVLLVVALLPVAGCALGLLLARKRKRTIVTVAQLVAAALMACSVAAVFLLPMLATRPSIDLDYIRQSAHGVFERNFLFFDEVAAGFTEAVIKPTVERAALVQLASGLLLVAAWWIVRFSVRKASQKGAVRDQAAGRAPWLAPAIALLSVAWVFFLQTALSAPVWRWTPGLSWTQFPWRLGAVQSIQIALLVGIVVRAGAAAAREPRRQLELLSWLSVVVVLILNAIVSLPLLGPTEWTLKGGAPEIDRRAHELWVPEYLPAAQEPEMASALGSGSALHQSTWNGHTVFPTVRTSHLRVFDLENDTGGELEDAFGFPGWIAEVNGGEKIPVTGGTGRLIVQVPAGARRVTLRYRALLPERLGVAISVVALVLLWPLAGRICDPPVGDRSELR